MRSDFNSNFVILPSFICFFSRSTTTQCHCTHEVLADAAEVVAADEHGDDLPVVVEVDVALGAVVVTQLSNQRLRLARHSAVRRARLSHVQLRAVHVVPAVRVVPVRAHLSTRE